MEKIYSKIHPEILLHIVLRSDDFIDGRLEVVPPNEFIQCAMLSMHKGKTFKPHKHNVHTVTDSDRLAQESWHVIKGRVKCTFYDIDDTIIAEPILKKGDTSFTLRGGHTYLIMSKDAKVLEYKTGKYIDQAYDKTFIE